MTKKKPYFANNWRAIKDTPSEHFAQYDGAGNYIPLSFEDFMEWKLQNWELCSSHCCVIRETNLKTGKVSEYTYKRPQAAHKKINEITKAGESEFIVCDEANLHCYTPRLNETDD